MKLRSSSASNGESAGGSPAGCASFNAALAQPPEALRSERRGRGWKSLTRHHFAHAVQRRGTKLKPSNVRVRILPRGPIWNANRTSVPGFGANERVPPGMWCKSTAFRHARVAQREPAALYPASHSISAGIRSVTGRAYHFVPIAQSTERSRPKRQAAGESPAGDTMCPCGVVQPTRLPLKQESTGAKPVRDASFIALKALSAMPSLGKRISPV